MCLYNDAQISSSLYETAKLAQYKITKDRVHTSRHFNKHNKQKWNTAVLRQN